MVGRVKIAIIKYLFNRNIPSGKNTSVEVKVYAECLSCVQLFDLVEFRGTFFVHQLIIGDIRNRHVGELFDLCVYPIQDIHALERIRYFGALG